MEQEIVFEAALVGERTKLVVAAVCFGEKESVNHFHCTENTENTEKLARIRMD